MGSASPPGDQDPPHQEEQPQQQQQLQQQEDLVLRALFNSDPNSVAASGALRPFHTTCSAGRAAALRTLSYLWFNHPHNQRDLSPQQQLALLAAADQATAFAIRTDQVQGLLSACQQQQQQHGNDEWTGGQQPPDVAPGMVVPGAGMTSAAGSAASATTTSSGKGGSTSSSSSSHTHSSTISDIITSSSSNTPGGLIAGTRPLMAPPWCVPQPCARLAQGLVVGPLSAATTQQVVQLLDALPGSQHLRQLVLFHPSNKQQGERKWRPVPFMLDWNERAVAAAIAGGGGAVVAGVYKPIASSSSSAGWGALRASSGVAGSWRMSCQVLLISKHGLLTPANAGTMPPLSTLAPLLAALPQLRLLYLGEVDVGGLSGCAAHLQQLRVLHLQHVVGLGALGVLDTLLSLSNLRYLGLRVCRLPPPTPMPDPPSSWVYLMSMDLSGTSCTPAMLEGLLMQCRGLQLLDLSRSQVGPSLPTSISRLPALRRLELSQSSVASLPGTMSRLTGLSHLTWHSRAGSPPLVLDEVWRLTGLRTLLLGCDTVTAVPAGVSRLTQLGRLSLTGRSLVELPSNLSKLVRLSELAVTANRGAAAAAVAPAGGQQALQLEAVYRLTRLTRLTISSDTLGALPVAMSCQLTALKILSVEGPCTMQLPQNLSCLTRLERLHVAAKQHAALPTGTSSALHAAGQLVLVYGLRNLKHLSVGWDTLTFTSSAIQQLTALTHLSLSSPLLVKLPAGFSRLRRLQELVVRADQLRAVPWGITALTQLRSVRLSPGVLPRLSPGVQAFLCGRSQPLP